MSTIQGLLADALALLQAGRAAEAETQVRLAMPEGREIPEALFLLGLIALQTDRPAEACVHLRRAIVLRPVFPLACRTLGDALRRLGALDQAVDAYWHAILLHPEDAESHYNLASTLHRLGRTAEAIPHYLQALTLRPAFPEACYNLGMAYQATGRSEDAVAAYRQAIAHRPTYAEAFSTLGTVLSQLGRHDEAVAACRHATLLRPHHGKDHYNLGYALKEAGHWAEAADSFRRSVTLDPGHAKAWAALGIVTGELGQVDDSVAAYRRAIELDPDDAQSHWNLSLHLLRQGDFAAGFGEYEWRWQRDSFPQAPRDYPQPTWDGQPYQGRLLVHAEQGLGDTLQFLRYLPQAAGLGGQLVVELPESLVGLAASLPVEVVASGQETAFDQHCPLLTLPRLLGAQLDDIPAAAGYLSPSPAARDRWRGSLPAGAIGLAWAGNPDHRNDARRSLALSCLAPLTTTGRPLVSLQKGEREAELAGSPLAPHILDLAPRLADLDDTAAAIMELDLVISADTAVAHLAGALGKPVWLLLPHAADWRWLEGRDDSPWYASMRLFRQEAPGDWDGVLRRVVAALGC